MRVTVSEYQHLEVCMCRYYNRQQLEIVDRIRVSKYRRVRFIHLRANTLCMDLYFILPSMG